MKKQLFNKNEILGKTITHLDYDNDVFIIEIDDKEFFVLKIKFNYGDKDYIRVSNDDMREYNPYSLRSFGLIDEDELNERKKILEEKQNDKKELELKELARLKAKYE